MGPIYFKRLGQEYRLLSAIFLQLFPYQVSLECQYAGIGKGRVVVAEKLTYI